MPLNEKQVHHVLHQGGTHPGQRREQQIESDAEQVGPIKGPAGNSLHFPVKGDRPRLIYWRLEKRGLSPILRQAGLVAGCSGGLARGLVAGNVAVYVGLLVKLVLVLTVEWIYQFDLAVFKIFDISGGHAEPS
jgi:hypothetical protein